MSLALLHLQEYQAPEVLRVPLEQLCLTVKATLPGAPPIQETLARLLTPPNPSAIAAAVATLRGMGALGAASEPGSGVHNAKIPSELESSEVVQGDGEDADTAWTASQSDANGCQAGQGTNLCSNAEVSSLSLHADLGILPDSLVDFYYRWQSPLLAIVVLVEYWVGQFLIITRVLRSPKFTANKGIQYRCLSPVLTIVAAMGYGRPVFQSPRRSPRGGQRRQARAHCRQHGCQVRPPGVSRGFRSLEPRAPQGRPPGSC